jgi:hypothetical protein
MESTFDDKLPGAERWQGRWSRATGKEEKRAMKGAKLSAVKPTNLAEEEAKFLADETYQPQFTYRDARAAQAACESMLAKDEYATLAQSVLERVTRCGVCLWLSLDWSFSAGNS